MAFHGAAGDLFTVELMGRRFSTAGPMLVAVQVLLLGIAKYAGLIPLLPGAWLLISPFIIPGPVLDSFSPIVVQCLANALSQFSAVVAVWAGSARHGQVPSGVKDDALWQTGLLLASAASILMWVALAFLRIFPLEAQSDRVSNNAISARSMGT